MIVYQHLFIKPHWLLEIKRAPQMPTIDFKQRTNNYQNNYKKCKIKLTKE